MQKHSRRWFDLRPNPTQAVAVWQTHYHAPSTATHYWHSFWLYRTQIRSLLPEAQKPWKGFLVLQTWIPRDSFLLNWFKPSGLGIPHPANGEFRFEECVRLSWQAQHVLIWKTEQETTELNLAERAASLKKEGEAYGWDWNLLPIEDVLINWVVEDTLLSTASSIFLNRTRKSNKWNNKSAS